MNKKEQFLDDIRKAGPVVVCKMRYTTNAHLFFGDEYDAKEAVRQFKTCKFYTVELLSSEEYLSKYDPTDHYVQAGY